MLVVSHLPAEALELIPAALMQFQQKSAKLNIFLSLFRMQLVQPNLCRKFLIDQVAALVHVRKLFVKNGRSFRGRVWLTWLVQIYISEKKQHSIFKCTYGPKN
jgi:hypothetical protein